MSILFVATVPVFMGEVARPPSYETNKT